MKAKANKNIRNFYKETLCPRNRETRFFNISEGKISFNNGNKDDKHKTLRITL